MLRSCVDASLFVEVNISHHFSSAWVLLCDFKWALWLNTLLHFEQGNGFSSVWNLSCFLKHHSCQISCLIWSRHAAFHLCGSLHGYIECHHDQIFCHLWSKSMTFLLYWPDHVSSIHHFFKKFFSHFEQANGFSPLWFLFFMFL